MGNAFIFNNIIVLLLIMIIGVISKKTNILDENTNRKLSSLLLNITLPCLIIMSFQFEFSLEMLGKAGLMFVIALVIHLFSALLGNIFFKKYSWDKKSVLITAAIFSNCVFVGFPIIRPIFGQEGVFYGSIYTVVYNIMLWTYAVMVFDKSDKKTNYLKKVMLNPAMISVIVGLFLFIFSIKLPFILAETFNMVGSMTTPISMLIIGCLLAEVKLKQIISSIDVYYISIVRLVVIPLITFGVLKLIGVDDVMTGSVVVLTAMPIAVMTAVFAEKYNADAAFASNCVAVSTVLAMITIPLFMLIL